MKSNIYLSIVFVLVIFSATLKAQYVSSYDENGKIKPAEQRKLDETQKNQKSQNTFISENKTVRCILPGSICEVTEVKYTGDNSYVRK